MGLRGRRGGGERSRPAPPLLKGRQDSPMPYILTSPSSYLRLQLEACSSFPRDKASGERKERVQGQA